MSTRAFNFNSIPVQKLKRSSFDLSHEFKFSAPLGKMIPICCFEALPGDAFKMNVSELTRFMALQSPMFQRVDVRFEFFKVPYRLIWKDYESFFTGGVDGTEKPTAPCFKLSSFCGADNEHYSALSTGGLLDYLGYPLPYRLTAQGTWEKIPSKDAAPGSDETFSSIPLNAYHCIYNAMYRDQNLIEETELADESKEYNANEVGDEYFELHNRAWRKDYFTSALTDPQRGQAVAIGLSGTAPVTGSATWSTNDSLELQADEEVLGNVNVGIGVDSNNSLAANLGGEDPTILNFHAASDTYFPVEGEADMSGASAVSIIALRTAFKLQQFLERNNIAGSRIVESDLAHFGVRGDDARMQRPELLGRFTVPVNVSPVASTADTTNAVVGELGGQAKSAGTSRTFRTFCKERSIIMGIMTIMPTASYSQGVSRMWTRKDKFDYFWREFEGVGEQVIKNRELFLDYVSGSETNNGDFGYQSRYSDYKFFPDRIAGDLRTSLSYWHMSRLFENTPALNQSFIECDPTDRVFAVKDAASDHHVVCDLWLSIKSLRPLSKYSTPRIS